MKKRCLSCILPLMTILLECLPTGAVCNFAASPTDRVRETFSYFDLTPFGYANFAPFLTAILTCLIFGLLVVFCLTGDPRMVAKAKNALYIATLLSLGPLIFGIAYFSVTGFLITLSLAAELLLLHITI